MQILSFIELGGRTGSHHIAVTRLRPGQQTSVHRHDFVELFLVENGQGLHLWNGQELPLRRGALALVQPRDAHSYRSAPGARLTFVNLAFPVWWWSGFLRLLSPAPEINSLLKGNPAGHVFLDPPSSREAAQRMHDLLERGAAEPMLLPEVVAGLLRHLMRPAAAVHSGAADHPDWLRQIVRDFSDPDLLAQPISSWQKRAGVSPEHLARTCRRFLGEPPTVLLNRARIEWVKLRLRQGEDKITALALDAGFQNVGFFYRCFRRFADCAPREWLAKHAANVTVPR
jgi:AraC family cel operon transcriptional repressor